MSQKVNNGRVSLFFLFFSFFLSFFFIRLCTLDSFLRNNPEQHVALYNPELSVSQKVRNGRVRLLLLDCARLTVPCEILTLNYTRNYKTLNFLYLRKSGMAE